MGHIFFGAVQVDDDGVQQYFPGLRQQYVEMDKLVIFPETRKGYIAKVGI